MLIGLIGNKRVGKDTFANYLVDNYNFEKKSFGEPLKEACKIIFDFTDEQIETDLKEKIDERWNISPRKVFQILGTEIFRDYLPNNINEFKNFKDEFWIIRFKKWYENNKDKNIIITDVRFINESENLKILGAKLIKINNLNIKYIDEHKSETENKEIKYDYLINNNSTIDEYYKNIDKLMNKIIN